MLKVSFCSLVFAQQYYELHLYMCQPFCVVRSDSLIDSLPYSKAGDCLDHLETLRAADLTKMLDCRATDSKRVAHSLPWLCLRDDIIQSMFKPRGLMLRHEGLTAPGMGNLTRLRCESA